MTVELTIEEIETLLASLKYSKQHISAASGTPTSVRQENLSKIEVVEAKRVTHGVVNRARL